MHVSLLPNQVANCLGILLATERHVIGDMEGLPIVLEGCASTTYFAFRTVNQVGYTKVVSLSSRLFQSVSATVSTIAMCA